jgi:hypothetical protein
LTTLNHILKVAPYSSNLIKQERFYLLALVRKIHCCRATQDLLIHYQPSLESVPTSVHLFAFPGPGEAFSPRLRSVLLHSSPVMHVRWNPVRQGRLALSCGGQAMYLWSEEWIGESGAEEEMAECVGIPASAFNKLRSYHSSVGAQAAHFSEKFNARDVQWAPDGKGLLLIDRETFCCAFEVEE